MHSVFFHVLVAGSIFVAQESATPVKQAPKKAGNWIFSTISVTGEKEPLQIAALPASTLVNLENRKKAAPYLVLYCQAGSARPLNAFLDMRRPIAQEGSVMVTLNGKAFPSFPMLALQPGDTTRWKLARDLTPLLKEAVQIEFVLPGYTAQFLLLHWPGIREQLLSSCR